MNTENSECLSSKMHRNFTISSTAITLQNAYILLKQINDKNYSLSIVSTTMDQKKLQKS